MAAAPGRWRPTDSVSAAAAELLQKLAEDLRRNIYAALWTELRSIGNWLGESDAISDYAELAADYRATDRGDGASCRRRGLSAWAAGDRAALDRVAVSV